MSGSDIVEMCARGNGGQLSVKKRKRYGSRNKRRCVKDLEVGVGFVDGELTLRVGVRVRAVSLARNVCEEKWVLPLIIFH